MEKYVACPNPALFSSTLEQDATVRTCILLLKRRNSFPNWTLTSVSCWNYSICFTIQARKLKLPCLKVLNQLVQQLFLSINSLYTVLRHDRPFDHCSLWEYSTNREGWTKIGVMASYTVPRPRLFLVPASLVPSPSCPLCVHPWPPVLCLCLLTLPSPWG